MSAENLAKMCAVKLSACNTFTMKIMSGENLAKTYAVKLTACNTLHLQ